MIMNHDFLPEVNRPAVLHGYKTSTCNNHKLNANLTCGTII